MGVFLVLVVLALLFVVTWLLKWLWNITIPGIFGLREIVYWEAFRLIIICSILFGGVRAGFAA